MLRTRKSIACKYALFSMRSLAGRIDFWPRTLCSLILIVLSLALHCLMWPSGSAISYCRRIMPIDATFLPMRLPSNRHYRRRATDVKLKHGRPALLVRKEVPCDRPATPDVHGQQCRARVAWPSSCHPATDNGLVRCAIRAAALWPRSTRSVAPTCESRSGRMPSKELESGPAVTSSTRTLYSFAGQFSLTNRHAFANHACLATPTQNLPALCVAASPHSVALPALCRIDITPVPAVH